ncbi:MAG: hypothetical protein L0Y75_03835 [Acidobacteria bacterium]|nr:hypothetical protein [Acidobacteriota bacterium]
MLFSENFCYEWKDYRFDGRILRHFAVLLNGLANKRLLFISASSYNPRRQTLQRFQLECYQIANCQLLIAHCLAGAVVGNVIRRRSHAGAYPAKQWAIGNGQWSMRLVAALPLNFVTFLEDV